MSDSLESGKKVSVRPKSSNGRGSIYLIPSKSKRRVYRAAIHDINGKRRTKNFSKRSDAEDWLAQQRQSKTHGLNTYATNPKMTVGEYLIGWLECHRNVIKHSTYRSYKSTIQNKIIPGIGKQIASTLTNKAIEAFYGELVANKIGGGTLNLVHRTLSCAYSDAVRIGDMPRNPVLNARKPNIKTIPTKPIPPEHWRKIYLEATKDPYTHARIEIGLMIGLRPGEVLGLKWKDINYENKTITIERQSQRGASGELEFQTVKQGAIRTVPLSTEQLVILKTHQRYQSINKAKWKVDEDLLFPNSVGGLLDEKKDRANFKKLIKSAGVLDYQLYQLRKTAFTNFSQQTDLRTLQAFSGHSQVSTLMGSYVFPTDESMKLAVGAMDRLRPSN